MTASALMGSCVSNCQDIRPGVGRGSGSPYPTEKASQAQKGEGVSHGHSCHFRAQALQVSTAEGPGSSCCLSPGGEQPRGLQVSRTISSFPVGSEGRRLISCPGALPSGLQCVLAFWPALPDWVHTPPWRSTGCWAGKAGP